MATLKLSEYVIDNGTVVLRKGLPKEHPKSYESMWKAKYKSLKDFPYAYFYGDYLKSSKIREAIKKFSIEKNNLNLF